MIVLTLDYWGRYLQLAIKSKSGAFVPKLEHLTLTPALTVAFASFVATRDISHALDLITEPGDAFPSQYLVGPGMPWHMRSPEEFSTNRSIPTCHRSLLADHIQARGRHFKHQRRPWTAEAH